MFQSQFTSTRLTTDAMWTRVVDSARLAPSSHNSQPWRFVSTGDTLTILADMSRRLPVVDPHDRELFISCGAAVEHAELAIRCQGFSVRTELGPRHGEVAVAKLMVTGRTPPEDLDRLLFDAIPMRQTSRVAFDPMPIPQHLEDTLRSACNSRGVSLHTLSDYQTRETLVDLIMAGDRLQMSNPQFRHELARWMRPNHSRKPDGMRGDAVGVGDIASYAAPLVIRTFDIGNRSAARDRQLVEASPLLVVLATRADHKVDWIRAGQALARMTLRAAADGFSASYLNQPIECTDLRGPLSELIDGSSNPQLILRIGRAPSVAGSSRRPMKDIYVANP